MKKLIMVALTISVSVQISYAQTWDEWFRQRKTQIEYLVKQIAALSIYADRLHDGYAIVKEGTNIIGDIKRGDFNLHKGYFTSLKSVNPAIKNYPKVAIIISDHATILYQFRELLLFFKKSEQFSATGQHYIYSVSSNLKRECGQLIYDLVMVLTSGELEMKDNERLQRIDKIFDDMKDKLSFTLSFCSQAGRLAYQRLKASKDIQLHRNFLVINK